jgi:hypothetical protein
MDFLVVKYNIKGKAEETFMKAHILKGSKQEIAENLVRINGEVCEAIVFEDELASGDTQVAAHPANDIFAEMIPYMVEVRVLDDSREAIYSQMDGE